MLFILPGGVGMGETLTYLNWLKNNKLQKIGRGYVPPAGRLLPRQITGSARRYHTRFLNFLLLLVVRLIKRLKQSKYTDNTVKVIH